MLIITCASYEKEVKKKKEIGIWLTLWLVLGEEKLLWWLVVVERVAASLAMVDFIWFSNFDFLLFISFISHFPFFLLLYLLSNGSKHFCFCSKTLISFYLLAFSLSTLGYIVNYLTSLFIGKDDGFITLVGGMIMIIGSFSLIFTLTIVDTSAKTCLSCHFYTSFYSVLEGQYQKIIK